MMIMKRLLLIVIFLTSGTIQVFARIHPAFLQEPGHCASSADLSPRWMSSIPDSRPFALLSLPGTHDSLSLHGGHQWQCQSMPLETQLQSGIRALDIRCRHVGNTFLIYHAFNYQHTSFVGVLRTCAAFLEENPSETIVMRVKKEWYDDGNNQSFEQSFVRQSEDFPGLFWRPEDSKMNSKLVTLGQVRGKIVILQDFDSHHHQKNEGSKYEAKKYGFPWAETVIQDDFTLFTVWSLYSKWLKVKEHLYVANSSLTTNLNPNSSASPRLHVNFLSGSVGVKPFFVASGHANWGTNQTRQYFGLINEASLNRYADFPRDRCILGGRYCLVDFEGTNILTYERLKAETFQYVGILYADFPGCGLIQAIINVNRQLIG